MKSHVVVSPLRLCLVMLVASCMMVSSAMGASTLDQHIDGQGDVPLLSDDDGCQPCSGGEKRICATAYCGPASAGVENGSFLDNRLQVPRFPHTSSVTFDDHLTKPDSPPPKS